MPAKYQIHTVPVAGHFPPITRSGVVAWEEGCLKCAKCVKKECVYQVYEKRSLDTRQMIDSLDSVCQDCFRCVQNCPNRLISKELNPAYKAIGNSYWSPDTLSNIWFQAETGRIPVSGGGYGGPFSGSGFDAMWTDMSEIVRPTRDGIHGREYISTSVDIGRKAMHLEFDARGNIFSPVHPLIEVPLPVFFDLLPWSPPPKQIRLALLRAAKRLGSFALIPQAEWLPEYEPYLGQTLLYLERGPAVLRKNRIAGLRFVEIPDGPKVLWQRAFLRKEKADLMVAVRLSLSENTGSRVLELTREGIEVIHLRADENGMEQGPEALFIKDRLKQIHLHLVEEGARDQVTLLAGGGIAMAEHMAKLIICGADAVACDIPALVAMECRVCKRCSEGISCPVELEGVDPAWGASRIVNLMAGWHSQLLEILGAMGIREVRRLRGEMGRAMFFEELEKEFAALGKREEKI
ncbi:MAG: glutamate synthase family protein [Deltaproteobacteria bacterium]|nr:glutamate synthase family protein [Deltaproteobacteria bacterium]